MITTDTFFTTHGERFLPTDHARGPWSRETLHGRVISGLLAHALESKHGDPAFQIARFTVDMYRVAPMAPVTIETEVAREGNRIRVIDAVLRSEGLDIARASAVMLRRTEQPDGKVWSPPNWVVPTPESLAPQEPRSGAPAITRWDARPLPPTEAGAKRAWIRETFGFVDGAPSSAFVKAAQVADYANPFANSGDQGLQFVNADITLYMDRQPRGEWIGLEVATHLSTKGVAIGECALFDLEGPFGRSLVCGVANRRT